MDRALYRIRPIVKCKGSDWSRLYSSGVEAPAIRQRAGESLMGHAPGADEPELHNKARSAVVSQLLVIGFADSSWVTCQHLMAKKIAMAQSSSGDVPESGLKMVTPVEMPLARQLIAAYGHPRVAFFQPENRST